MSKNVADSDINNYLTHLNVPKQLSDEEGDSIEGDITYDECNIAVNMLKINKSPGLDGIPSEFYHKFWGRIGNIIVESFNESYEI